jgi:hypothetical protein
VAVEDDGEEPEGELVEGRRAPTTGAMPWQYPSDVFKHE